MARLELVVLAAAIAHVVAPDVLSSTCGDAAADNYAGEAAAASSRGGADNRGCVYTCAGLARHFGVSGEVGECFVDAGADANWPSAEVILKDGGRTTIIQGHVGGDGKGGTALEFPVTWHGGEGVAQGIGGLVLRHLKVVALPPTKDAHIYIMPSPFRAVVVEFSLFQDLPSTALLVHTSGADEGPEGFEVRVRDTAFIRTDGGCGGKPSFKQGTRFCLSAAGGVPTTSRSTCSTSSKAIRLS